MPRSNTVIRLVHSAFSPDHSLLLNCYTAAAPLTLPLSTVGIRVVLLDTKEGTTKRLTALAVAWRH